MFLKNLEDFSTLTLNKKVPLVSRGRTNLPVLSYKVQGNYFYIENYQALAKYTNRSIDLLSKFFSARLGCIAEVTDSYFRLKGNLKIVRVKQTEKLYYSKEVLCPVCQSPETNRKQDLVFCLNCQLEQKRPL